MLTRQQDLPALQPRRNPFRREVGVDLDVEYTRLNKKRLQPLIKDHKQEYQAAAQVVKVPDKEHNVAQKLQQLWRRKHLQHKERRRRARGRARQMMMRFRGRIVHVALHFANGLAKLRLLPLRRFKSKQELEQHAEKERVRQNRMEMMASVMQHSRKEDHYKRSLRRKRMAQLAKEDQTEVQRERRRSIEREQKEKGTAIARDSQKRSSGEMEEELDRHEESLAASAKEGQNNQDGADPADGVRTRARKQKMGPSGSPSSSSTGAQLGTGTSETSNREPEGGETSGAGANAELRHRLQRMLSRQHSKVLEWEEKEKSRWNALRKRWAARKEGKRHRKYVASLAFTSFYASCLYLSGPTNCGSRHSAELSPRAYMTHSTPRLLLPILRWDSFRLFAWRY